MDKYIKSKSIKKVTTISVANINIDISLLRDNYGSSKIECPLGDLFWVCSDVFFGR